MTDPRQTCGHEVKNVFFVLFCFFNFILYYFGGSVSDPSDRIKPSL